jgi:hypothetical protein
MNGFQIGSKRLKVQHKRTMGDDDGIMSGGGIGGGGGMGGYKGNQQKNYSNNNHLNQYKIPLSREYNQQQQHHHQQQNNTYQQNNEIYQRHIFEVIFFI